SAVLWTAAVSWGTPCVGCTRAPSHADSAARDESSQGSLEARGSGGSLEATGSEDLQGAQAATVQGAVHDDLSERRLELDLVHPELGPMPTLVHVPARTHEQQRLPILIAFHGMGESRKGPQRGVLGWLQDYALEETLHRLSAPPLTRGDFAGFV